MASVIVGSRLGNGENAAAFGRKYAFLLRTEKGENIDEHLAGQKCPAPGKAGRYSFLGYSRSATAARSSRSSASVSSSRT